MIRPPFCFIASQDERREVVIMCGRYVLHHSLRELQARFGAEQLDLPFSPRYNVAPTQAMPIVTQQGENRAIALMTWGLIPAWAKDTKPGFATINARAEGIAEKPAFRVPIRRHRCLVPADGYYEWQARDGKKQPYFIHFTDNRIFAFAGLYDIHRAADGADLHTYTIITTTPNTTLAPLHDRMAVILKPEDEAEWLDPGVTDPFQVTRLLRPYEISDIEAYPIGPQVNRPAYDAPDLLSPLGPI
jgi:putative SOS response-associated peptidase YedK